MSTYLTHKNPIGVTRIKFRLVWGQIRALTFAKNISNVFQDQILVVKFTESCD